MKRQETTLFLQTFQLLQQFCIPAIDQMFLKMINEDWSKESLETNKHLILTFLRGNFIIRKELTLYEEFLNKSKKYLIEHNQDVDKLLRGIV